MPPPPRITVLPSLKGCQANPNRGAVKTPSLYTIEDGKPGVVGVRIPLVVLPDPGTTRPAYTEGNCAPVSGLMATFLPLILAGAKSVGACAGLNRYGTKFPALLL